MLEAEAKILASTPVWPRDLNITAEMRVIVLHPYAKSEVRIGFPVPVPKMLLISGHGRR